MDNIEDLLRALVDGDGCGEQCCEDCEDWDKQGCEECECESGGDIGNNCDNGLFSGLDPEMLIKLMGLLELLNQPDDTERFLLALKPLLRAENRVKIDSALKLIKLISLLPILREAGLTDMLF